MNHIINNQALSANRSRGSVSSKAQNSNLGGNVSWSEPKDQVTFSGSENSGPSFILPKREDFVRWTRPKDGTCDENSCKSYDPSISMKLAVEPKEIKSPRFDDLARPLG